MSEHPIVDYVLRVYPTQFDRQRMVRDLVDQWLQLAALSPGDPVARATIATGFDLLRRIRYETLAPLANFEYESWNLLHRESLRLLGEGRPPSWSPGAAARSAWRESFGGSMHCDESTCDTTILATKENTR